MSALFDLFAKLTLDSSEYNEGLDEAEKKASGFGGALKTACKVGVTAVAAVGTAAIGAGTALVKGTSAIAEYGDNIDKMSQKMGMTAEAYQEWDAVMQHSGTSMETMKASMKTLANAAETGSDAFKKLGISEEELKSLNQQELFERTIAALQNVEDETTRTYLAGKTLGKGATELGALLNTSAEDTQAMRDRVHELGGVMSDEAVKAAAAYQDSLQDMTTAISSVKRGLLSNFLPAITTTMDGITEIFGGDGGKGGELLSEGIGGILTKFDESVPQFMEKAGTIVSAISTALTEHLPSIMEKGAEIVISIASGILEEAPNALAMGMNIVTTVATSIFEALPALVETGAKMISNISSGLVTGIPKFVAQAVAMIPKFIETLGSSASSLTDAGISLVLNLTQGIIDAIPELLAQLPAIVSSIATIFVENGPKLLDAGMQLITMLANGILDTIPVILATIPEIFSALKEKWTSVDWSGLGKQVVNFICNGIKALLTNIPSVLKQIGTSAISWFKAVDWASAGSSVINTIVSAVLALFNDIPNALRTIGNSAWDAISGIDWYSIGSNIISGIANGIWNGASRIADAARDAARSALNAAKNFLGIQSPSKRFRNEVGLMIGRGTALGVTDSEDEVDKAIEGLHDKMITGLDFPYEFSPTFEAVPDSGLPADSGKVVNITNNITVDGADDPEDYASRLVRELELQLRAV